MGGAPFKLLSQEDFNKLSLRDQLAYTRAHMAELRRQLDQTKRHLEEAKETIARMKKAQLKKL